MSNLRNIKELAEKEFPIFVNDIMENHPDLYLKFIITNDMKNIFIEAVLKQFWVQEEFSKIKILEYMQVKYLNHA